MLLDTEIKMLWYSSVDKEVLFRVFWTGTTKTGCVGQFKDCFIDVSKESIFEGTILPSDIGGSCVAVIRYGDRFIAKIKPCESKAYLACQGSSTVENATIMTYVSFFGLIFRTLAPAKITLAARGHQCKLHLEQSQFSRTIFCGLCNLWHAHDY
jgi:hypothetical protein